MKIHEFILMQENRYLLAVYTIILTVVVIVGCILIIISSYKNIDVIEEIPTK